MCNRQSRFSINTPEDLYDRSIRKTSSQYGTTFSSIASSRATIPTIAPYLPDLEEEESHDLERISLSESVHEATIDFDVDPEVLPQPPSSPKPAKVVMMTFAETQTDYDNDDYVVTDEGTDDDFEFRVDIV